MIVVGLMRIGLEIERVERSYLLLAGHANPGSVMFWMIMFHVLYVVLLVIEMWFYFRDDLLKQSEEVGLRGFIAKIISLRFLGEFFAKSDGKLNLEFARGVGFATAATAVVAHSNLGALFAVNYLPFWHGAELPVYFIVSAVVSGAALTIIAAVLADWLKGKKIVDERYEVLQTLRFVLGFALIVEVFFTAWKLIIRGYPTAGWFANEAVKVFIEGSYAFNFWFFEIFIGVLIPLVILASPLGRNVDALFVAAFLVVVGIFFLRVDPVMGGQAMVIDVEKYIGCGKRVVACKTENGVPMDLPISRTWTEGYSVEYGSPFSETKVQKIVLNTSENPFLRARWKYENVFFVPKLCNHCSKAPCVEVCPVYARFYTREGVVLVDKDSYIGCKYCVTACPYGATFLHPEQHVTDKCTFCYHRVKRGPQPACVAACPTNARVFGYINDESGEVYRLLKENRGDDGRRKTTTRALSA